MNVWQKHTACGITCLNLFVPNLCTHCTVSVYEDGWQNSSTVKWSQNISFTPWWLAAAKMIPVVVTLQRKHFIFYCVSKTEPQSCRPPPCQPWWVMGPNRNISSGWCSSVYFAVNLIEAFDAIKRGFHNLTAEPYLGCFGLMFYPVGGRGDSSSFLMYSRWLLEEGGFILELFYISWK